MKYFEQFNTLDASKAKAAGGSLSISRSGKFTGKFNQAVCFEAPSGAKGVEFEFESDQGERASFSIFTGKKDGGESFGVNQIHAITCCMRQRSATLATAKATVWDNQAKARVEKLMPQLAGLLDKPIGVLLEKEEYINGNGETRYRMNFKHPFEADTDLMADEILAQKTEPVRLPVEVSRLKDQIAKPKGGGGNPRNGANQDERNPSPDDFDSDIPF